MGRTKSVSLCVLYRDSYNRLSAYGSRRYLTLDPVDHYDNDRDWQPSDIDIADSTYNPTPMYNTATFCAFCQLHVVRKLFKTSLLLQNTLRPVLPDNNRYDGASLQPRPFRKHLPGD